jgi:hypothetical protein
MSMNMKKALVICLAMALVMSLSIGALAIPGGFINSPSGNRAPVIETFKPLDDDCTANLIITIFGDRMNLPEEQRQPFEDAYNDIINSNNLTDLNKDLADLASQLGIDSSKLGVSDLFDLSSSGCEDHNGHKQYKVTLDTDTLEHFVGVIYRTDDGKWHLIEDAKVVDGKLQFTAEGYYPYALVVDTTEGKPSKTGDTNLILICGAVMAAAAVGLAVVLVMRKKQRS